MSPTIENLSAKEVRSRYAFLFGVIAELSVLRYGGERPSTRFDDIKMTANQLKGDGYLSEYLSANIEALFEMYPTMLPGLPQKKERLGELYELLGLVIGDLCAEIKEITDESEEHDREMLLKSLLG